MVAADLARANEAQFSGAYMMHVCARDAKGNEKVLNGHATCQSYIAGVVDYHTLVRSLGTAPSVDFCLPKGVKIKTLHDVVLRYLKKNPENHSEFLASPAVALALFEEYPCKK